MRNLLTMMMVLVLGALAACNQETKSREQVAPAGPTPMAVKKKKNVCEIKDDDYWKCINGCTRIKYEDKKRICDAGCDLLCTGGI